MKKREVDETVYAADAFWPEDLVKVDEVWVHTQKFVRIEYRPVQYNPITKTLRVYEDLESKVRFEEEAVYVPVQQATEWEPDSSCEKLYGVYAP